MSMMKRTFILVAVSAALLSLNGCSLADLFGTSQALVDIVDENGKVIGKVGDTALARDFAYMNRGNTRDKYDRDMYKESGVKVKYAKVDLGNGSFAWLPEETTVRAPHTWQQGIETRPPDHRGWATADNIVDNVFNGFIGWLLADTYKTSNSQEKFRYNGDYIYNSQNPATTNFAPPLAP